MKEVTFCCLPTNGATLTAVSATDDPWGSGVSHQWTVDGRAIPGATGPTLAITAAYAGTTIGLTASAANTAGNSSASAATPTKVTTKPVITTQVVPVRGTRRVGYTVRVSPPAARAFPKPKVSYQWRRNGKAIKGKTKASYKLVKADRGKSISCRITLKNSLGSSSKTSMTIRVR
jgi:hypothetical protein